MNEAISNIGNRRERKESIKIPPRSIKRLLLYTSESGGFLKACGLCALQPDTGGLKGFACTEVHGGLLPIEGDVQPQSEFIVVDNNIPKPDAPGAVPLLSCSLR